MEIVASSPQGSLVGDSPMYFLSSAHKKKSFTFHSHKFKSMILFTFKLPQTKHLLSLCTQTSWFSLFCHFIRSISLWAGIPERWVKWHHMLWMNPAYTALKPKRYDMKKDTVVRKEEKRRIPPMDKVCSACWGLIKDRLYKNQNGILTRNCVLTQKCCRKGLRWASRSLDDCIRINCTCLDSTLCQSVISGLSCFLMWMFKQNTIS